MWLAAHLQRCVGQHRLAGLHDPAIAGEHLAGEDQGLRAGAALGQPALKQRLVGALLAALSHLPARAAPGRLSAMPKARSAVAVMSFAVRFAAMSCLAWVSWSMKRSGRVIG